MSTKTMKQRIALVAVSALTAGVLSVVSAPASNAAVGGATVGAVNIAAAGATTNPQLTHFDRLFIATMPSTTGSGVALTSETRTPESAATGSGPNTSSAKSLGLINVSDIAAGLTAGTTQTATLLSTGRLSVYTATGTADGEYSAIVVTGGTIASSTGTYLNSTATVAGGGAATGDLTFGAVIAPSSGSTTMVVRLYTGLTSTTVVTAPTTGDLEGQISVTVAAASTANAISATNSAVYGAIANNDTAQTRDATAAEGFLASRTYGTSIFFNVRVLDAYGTAINAGTAGILQVSATNGALVGVGTTAPVGTTSTAFASIATPDDYMISVAAPSTAPVSTTVTVSFNGTVIGTRSVVFTGEVAKITLSSPVIGTLGTSTGNSVGYKLTDAAGNAIYSTIGTTAITNYSINALIGDSSLATAIGVIVRDTAPSIDANGVIAASDVLFTCPAAAASGTVALTYTNPSGTIVKSNVQAVKCAGAALGYTASWDKASYIPGDIAKLTVSFKDSKGNAANDVDAIATTLPVISIGGLDKTVTGPTTADLADQGEVVYTYTVGATPGAFSGTVKFATVDARYAAATGLTAKAVTTSLTVKESSASVSNADVLKSIVALIASINKQIQALQKLILKR